MEKSFKWRCLFVLPTLVFFVAFLIAESNAWARAGRSGSSGSRGSRSFSAPSVPSGPSYGSSGMRAPGRAPAPGMPAQAQGRFSGQSPFMSGLAGGLAGGLLGGMLFGSAGHAAAGPGAARGGIGLLDIVIIGLLLFLAWRFFKRRRASAFQERTRDRDMQDRYYR